MPDDSAAPEPALLKSFLASRDVACPACRYNLRGTPGDTCPECGESLSLAVGARGMAWRRSWLLVLLFAWLFAAGAMNAYRSGRSIYQTATQWPQVLWTSLPPAPLPPTPPVSLAMGSAPLVTTNATSADDVATDRLVEELETVLEGPADEPDETAAPAPSVPLPGGTTLSASRITIDTGGLVNLNVSGQVRLMNTAGPGRRWSNVAWTQWAAGAWWSILALVAAAALVLVLRQRRHDSARIARLLVWMAWLGFAGYFAYHVVDFVNEVM